MRRARPKPPRIRVVKTKPRRFNGAANQIHDEDVLRWRRMFNDEEALAAACLAGPGASGLPVCQDSPALSPEQCSNAVQYVNTLTDDARRAVFKHCEMVSRHERMLLEGQERLKYVQAQIREMKAQMPAPPHMSAPWPRDPSQKGPEVTAEPLPEPSCWASCCGLFPLPPPPAPPTLQNPGPLVVQLPDESYFREAAARTAAERDWEREQAAAAAMSLEGEGAASFSSSAPTQLEPVSGSVGGASEATAAAGACAAHAHPHGHVHAGLPGQLDGLTAGPPPAALQSAPSVCPFCAPTRTTKGPGTPQSLLRPLASLPAPPAVAAGGPSEAGARRASALPALQQAPTAGGADAPGSQEAPSAAAAPDPVAAAAAAVTTATTAAGAVSQTAPPGGAAAAPLDLSRYQDPESIRKITQIQAAQRGRMARKQATGMRAQRQQPQQQHRQSGGMTETALTTAAAAPAPTQDAAATLMSGGGGSVRERQGELAPEAPRPMSPLPPLPMAAAAPQIAAPPVLLPLHPFADPVYGAGAKLPALPGIGGSGGSRSGGGGGAVAAVDAVADAGGMDRPVYDLTPYQNPESIRKITQIQAAQRGRMARKQATGMRAQRQQKQPDGGSGIGGEGGVDAAIHGMTGPLGEGGGGGAASGTVAPEFRKAESVRDPDKGGGGSGALFEEPSF